MVDVADHMVSITKEARRMKAKLPRGHAFELADLVSAGALHVLEYLRFDCSAGPGLVRVWARHGMLAAIRNWEPGTKRYRLYADRFRAYDEAEPTITIRASTPPPPIELMIDLLRELLKLPLGDALAWTSRRLCDNDHDVAARELREAPSSQKNRVSRAGAALTTALREYEPRPSKTPHARAVELFRRGGSVASVARAAGMSQARAATIQDSIDPLAKTRRAAQARRMRVERTDIETADLIRLRRLGWTQQGIADHLGCSQKLVNSRLNKLGLLNGRIDSRRHSHRGTLNAHPKNDRA